MTQREEAPSLPPGTPRPWTPSPWTPWLALAATLLLIGFLEHRRQPPEPAKANAPIEVFSAARAFDALATILGASQSGKVESHPTGSEAAARVRERIEAELVARGVSADAIEIQETVACRDSDRWSYVGCTPVKNLVATLPGPSVGRGAGPALVLMSHYDSVGAGPGISDDAVGVAAMLETVRALLADDPAGANRRHPVVVLVTDAEEVGLFGARGFVDRHPIATEGRVGAVLNLEARGTQGQSLLFQASDDDAWIVDAYRQAASRPATSSLYAEVYRRLPNDTDLSVFLDAGIAGINFAYAEGVQRYHTPRDDLAHLDRGSLQHHGDHLLAMTRALASHPQLGDPPTGRAVYSDVASYFVVAYPLAWALPLAALAFLGILALAGVSIRRGESTAKQLLATVGGLLVATVVTVVLAWLYGELVKQIGGSQRPGWAHPLPFRVGLWTLVFLLPAGLHGGLRRLGRKVPALDVTAWTATLASWICLGLLAVALAAAVPGVSLFATLPAFVAVLLGSLALWSRSGRFQEAALVGVALATAFFWFNIARGLEMGMGLHNAALVAVPLAVCTWTFAAFFWADRRPVRLVTVTLSVAVLSGFAGVLLVPPYSQTDPQGVNVVHLEEHDQDGTTSATLWVDSGVDPPPEELISAAGLESKPEQAPDGLRLGSAYRGPTETVGQEAPRLEIVSVESLVDGRSVTLRMVGPSADFLRLQLAEETELRRVVVAGYDFDLSAKEVPGSHLLLCTGPECDGVEFTLVIGGSEPVLGELYAIRYGSIHGLPEAARRVADARPDWAVPVHSGDRTAVRFPVTLP